MADTSTPFPPGYSNTCVKAKPRQIPWIWEGVVAERAITLLSAPEKIGKTTLLSLLLDRRRAGGQLLGRDVFPGRTVLCTEEHEQLWALRQPPLDFGPELIFLRTQCEPPSRRRWGRIINDLCGYSFRQEPLLVVIDSAVNFMPLSERRKQTLRWALGHLRGFAGDPIGFLILNQTGNMHRPLAGFADMVFQMSMPRDPDSRRRTLRGSGRYPGMLKSATAELNPEGTDYLLLEDSAPPPPPILSTVQALLSASPTPLTPQELLARWPGTAPRPDRLWRTLVRGCQLDLFLRSGAGTKTEAFRYEIRVAPAEPALGAARPEVAIEGSATETAPAGEPSGAACAPSPLEPTPPPAPALAPTDVTVAGPALPEDKIDGNTTETAPAKAR